MSELDRYGPVQQSIDAILQSVADTRELFAEQKKQLEELRDRISSRDHQLEVAQATITALKLRALAAHEALWRAMNDTPEAAIAAVGDDGYLHAAVEAIISVDTESVTTPEEWRAHIEQQDRRIDRLEEQRRELASALGAAEGRIGVLESDGRRLLDCSHKLLGWIGSEPPTKELDALHETIGGIENGPLGFAPHIRIGAERCCIRCHAPAPKWIAYLCELCWPDAVRVREEISSEGAMRIAAERERQTTQEGWTPEHDDEHDDRSLVFAAICYAAAPEEMYRVRRLPNGGALTEDVWPGSWDEDWDKRPRKRRKYDRGDLREPSHDEGIRMLEKAGALIAAEIDRLLRAQVREQ